MEHPDWGWREAVQGNSTHARSKEIVPGVRGFLKSGIHFRAYICGLGIVIGNQAKRFCLPLSIRLHDGLQFLETWKGGRVKTHVVQMVEDAYDAARTFGNSLLLLDRYFHSVPALERFAQLNASGPVRVEMITKAKLNCVAFKLPERKSGRGRPAKKGDRLAVLVPPDDHALHTRRGYQGY